MLQPMARCSNGRAGGTGEKKGRESHGKSRPVVGRQQVMWGVKKRGSRKREIPFCARSKAGKIKYPRTCPIHICADVISGALTEICYSTDVGSL
jgi:hypothetical protein